MLIVIATIIFGEILDSKQLTYRNDSIEVMRCCCFDEWNLNVESFFQQMPGRGISANQVELENGYLTRHRNNIIWVQHYNEYI